MPKFSIITVCYNSAATLERTLQSVAAQTCRDFEHILIDGQSTDQSLDIARRFENEYPSQIISQRDSGIYDAMNKGLERASGDYVHFLNSDDFYCAPDSLQRVSQQLDPGRLNYANLLYHNVAGEMQIRAFQYRKWRLHIGCYIYQPVTLYPRSLCQTVGKFDTRFRIAADYDYLLRCLKVAPPNHIPEEFVEMSPGGVSNTDVRRSFMEFRQISERHGCPGWLAGAICQLKTWNAERKIRRAGQKSRLTPQQT